MNEKENRENIKEISIREEMERSYIDYSMSVIVSRALPDVRDGFKPVHRRIIFGMHELGFTSDKPHRKSARIVGEVLGKFHPHGDSSIYNAMVRLAQPFATRYPLVDAQGNFGSIDGDGAAAMRYTEARMSKFTEEMLRDINKNTVDFYPNFDETTEQPEVLPSRFPNLLVNGSTGIAVGMTTSIPPHNLSEVINATIRLIDNEETTIDELLEDIKGPDFPTGAIVLANNQMMNAYKHGRGKVKIRAKAEIEQHGNKERIVITAIPYMLNKMKMLKDIANLVKSKRIEGITELRDETSRKGIRVVMELRRDVNSNVILNQLYKYTSMQTSFSMIFIALDHGQPKRMNLKEILSKYIDHQREVETRRVQFDLDKALDRAHIVEGLLKALDHIDEIIRIIRSAYDDAKEQLIEKFDFSDIQAQSILDMRLKRLQGLEYEKLANELKELNEAISYYRSVLADHKLLDGIIKDHLIRIRDKFSDERRTEIKIDTSEIEIEDLIDEEEMMITLTKEGYIKRTAQDTYQSQNRGGRGIQALSTKDEDRIYDIVSSSTHDTLLLFTNKGRLYNVKTYRIPKSSRQSKGMPLINLIPIEKDEYVRSMIPIEVFKDAYIMMVTKKGIVNKFRLEDLQTNYTTGINVIRVDEDDEIVEAVLLHDGDDVFLSTKHGSSLRFNESQVRPTGRNTRGVRGIKLRAGDELISQSIIHDKGYIFSVTENGFGKCTKVEEYRSASRGGLGIINYKVTNKTGNVITTLFVQDNDEIMLINSDDIMIRIRVSDISVIGRSTSGVHVMNITEDASVVSASKVIDLEGREDGTED